MSHKAFNAIDLDTSGVSNMPIGPLTIRLVKRTDGVFVLRLKNQDGTITDIQLGIDSVADTINAMNSVLQTHDQSIISLTETVNRLQASINSLTQDFNSLITTNEELQNDIDRLLSHGHIHDGKNGPVHKITFPEE